MNDALIEVASFSTEADARVAAGGLCAEGIDAVVEAVGLGGSANLVPSPNGARVLVPAPDEVAARRLLEQAEAESDKVLNREWMEVPAAEIEDGLALIRGRRRLHVTTWAAGFPAVLLGAFVQSETAALVCILGAFLAFRVSGLYVQRTRCPRCGTAYDRAFGRQVSLFTGRIACTRCGLPLAGDAAAGAR